jgi:hypothetical protein
LSIDVEGLWSAIKAACEALLQKHADKLVSRMREYIKADGAGKTLWREHAAQEFRKIEENFSTDVFSIVVGTRDDLAGQAWSDVYAAQIMVALFGNHPPIYTKPGSEVFSDAMLFRQESWAQSIWGIPQFGWKDPNFQSMLENVLKEFSSEFAGDVENLLKGINFYDFVYVS